MSGFVSGIIIGACASSDLRLLSHMMGSMNRQKARAIVSFLKTQRHFRIRQALHAVVIQAAQYRPRFEGGIIAFAAGIALYFALPFEPHLWMCAVICAALFGIYWGLNRNVVAFVGLALGLFAMSLGIGRAALHSFAVNTSTLPHYERSYDVTGWIAQINRSGASVRYVIEVTELGGVSVKNTPKAVRVRLARLPDTPLQAGDSVTIRAIAKSPPGPVVPNGYDPARRAYFDGLGGFGFAISQPEKIPDLKLGFRQSLKRHISRWRYSLADRIYSQSPSETAGLQAALMTGVRRYIPPEQTENLRIAGLAHILAISGLHMGLLAGGTYGVVTFLLALITPLSRRYDIRKVAAVIGALTAMFYLVLSGMSVATQRAFIMASIVFLAVILDRRAVSMRSVAVAAFVTLLLHPESLVSVGFQMSFAAVAALVATYQIWQRYRPVYKVRNYGRKAADFFASLSVTSFVAGLATGGFAIFHFNRISQYGFVGNLLAMPLFSLAVMPLAVVSFIAMPFGVEAVPLRAMGNAISYILDAANWVASWPNAMIYVPSAPNYILSLFAAGFVAICLGKIWGRVLGLAVMAICVSLWSQSPSAGLRVSEDGRIAFWLGTEGLQETGQRLMVDRRRADRYGREQFSQMAGRPDSLWVDYEKSFADCDLLACRFELRGLRISVMKHPSEVITECGQVDLAILTEREAGPVARRHCSERGTVFIDARILRESGAQNIYIEPHDIKPIICLEPSRSKARQKRPWGN